MAFSLEKPCLFVVICDAGSEVKENRLSHGRSFDSRFLDYFSRSKSIPPGS